MNAQEILFSQLGEEANEVAQMTSKINDLNEIANWEVPMQKVVKNFLDSIDSLPHHFTLHLIHAAEIIGYKHSDKRIRAWWESTYERFCHDMHMKVESVDEMDNRLDDDEVKWRADASRFKS